MHFVFATKFASKSGLGKSKERVLLENQKETLKSEEKNTQLRERNQHQINGSYKIERTIEKKRIRTHDADYIVHSRSFLVRHLIAILVVLTWWINLPVNVNPRKNAKLVR